MFMARKPRLHINGAFYHVMLRGNNGQNIFYTDLDRQVFYRLLEEGIQKYNHRIHAFCLMSNHVHLLLEIGEVPLSKVMQNVCFRYARWVNSCQESVGHLFQGRFKSKLVDTDQYLLKLLHYIHSNPLEAGLVTNPRYYCWSSHLAYLQMEGIQWLTTEYVLSLFDNTFGPAVRKYSNFIFKENLKFSDNKKRIINNHSILSILSTLSACAVRMDNFISKEDVIKQVCSQYGVTEEILQGSSRLHQYSRIRALIACLVQKTNGGTLTSVAKYFNRDVSGIIRTLHRLEQEKGFNDEITVLLERLKKSTSQA